MTPTLTRNELRRSFKTYKIINHEQRRMGHCTYLFVSERNMAFKLNKMGSDFDVTLPLNYVNDLCDAIEQWE